MGFFSSTTGQYCSVSDVNQFFDAFNGSVAPSSFPNILGSSTQDCMDVYLPTAYVSDQDFFDIGLNGSPGGIGCYYDDKGGTNYGGLHATINASTYFNWLAYSAGWYTSSPVIIDQNLNTSNSVTCASINLSGSPVFSGMLTTGSTSNLTVTAIGSGGVWENGSGNSSLEFLDDATNGYIDFFPSGSSSRGFVVQGTNATGTNNSCWRAATSSILVFYESLNLTTNSIAGVTYPGGSGNATVSHGLGTTPTSAQACIEGTSALGCTTCNVGSSTIQVISGGNPWVALCWAY